MDSRNIMINDCKYDYIINVKPLLNTTKSTKSSFTENDEHAIIQANLIAYKSTVKLKWDNDCGASIFLHEEYIKYMLQRG